MVAVLNYFQLFGLEQDFELDSQALSSTFQTLQKAVHPDKFAHASSQEQLMAVQKSSTINDAYQTLKAPLSRAEYLLKVRGVDMPDAQATVGDMQFLMRQMELREMLEEISGADDIDAALFDASQTLDQEYLSLMKTLSAELAENSELSNQSASENLRKLKFYQKLNIELERLEEQLLD